MTWTLSDEEYEATLCLSDTGRYAYFIDKVSNQGLLWSLAGETGWVLAGDSEGQEVFPVWPHPRFAAACATGSWEGDEPRSIDLSAWLERWIPGMLRDRKKIAVFPTSAAYDKGIVVPPDRLRADLQRELSQYHLQLESLAGGSPPRVAIESTLEDTDLHAAGHRVRHYE
jgi:hypothetical protein